jgi:hypothetical protein
VTTDVRPALIVTVAFATLASGCATGAAHERKLCYTNALGNCLEDSAISAAIGLGALVVGGVIYAAVTRPPHPSDRRPAPPERPLEGRVRWQGATDEDPSLPVTLRGAESPVVLRTTTEEGGRFQFPFPRKAGWYTLAVATDAAEGETTVWLQDRRPAALEVLVRPRPPNASAGSPR